MNYQSDEMISLAYYIKNKMKNINENLKPFYERCENRANSGMNMYGCATIPEKHLLKEQERLFDLENKLKMYTNLNSLVNNLEIELKNCSDNIKKYDIEYQLELIKGYIEVEENVTENKRG